MKCSLGDVYQVRFMLVGVFIAVYLLQTALGGTSLYGTVKVTAFKWISGKILVPLSCFCVGFQSVPVVLLAL